MNEKIQRTVEARKTVNHPANPEVVIGFTGRDPRLGANVLLLKQNSISRGNTLDGEAVIIPNEQHEDLGVLTDTLILLNGDEAQVMTGEFAREAATLHTFDFEGGRNTLHVVYLDDPNFMTMPRESVDVTN